MLALVLLTLAAAHSLAAADALNATNTTHFDAVPSARAGATGTSTDVGTLLLFGGVLQSGKLAAPDVWEYSWTLDRWACLCDGVVAPTPTARTGHAASYGGAWLVVHGGRGESGAELGDTWTFSAAARSWQPVTLLDSSVQPLPRAGHAVVVANATNSSFVLYAVGGSSGTRVLNDVWRLDVALDSQNNATGLVGNWTVVRRSDAALGGSSAAARRRSAWVLLALMAGALLS